MKSALIADMMLFVAVVDKKSFTAAGDEFNVSKSVVSKRITRLEQKLGTQLLYRSTRKLSVSEVGQVLYERALQIKAQLEEVENVVCANRSAPSGTLRVLCPSSFGQLHLAPAIADFIKQYPHIKVELLLSSLNDDLIESGIDVAIRIGELSDSSYIAKRLTVRKMRVCAAPSYLKLHGEPLVPEDLKNHNCLTHLHASKGSDWKFRKGKKEYSVEVSGNLSAASSQSLEAAAVAGLGIVMLPGYMMTSDMQKGNLVRLLLDYCQEEIGIHALYPQTRHMAPKVRAFVDFMYERFRHESYWI